MPSPIDDLRKARADWVEARRRRVLSGEPIADLQAEIEAIDRAIADETKMAEPARPDPAAPYIAPRQSPPRSRVR